jgi:isoleucyl-tRNA synthetase
MVNKIQNMRKSSGFDVTDHITVHVRGTALLRSAVGRFDDFIRRETLARSIEFLDSDPLDGGTQWNINGEDAAIAVKKL